MTNQEPIPEEVIEALLAVRETGLVNMMDRRGVAMIASVEGFHGAYVWLMDPDGEGRKRYVEALRLMGDRLGDERPRQAGHL